MDAKHYFNKPEYFFQPYHLLKKLVRVVGGKPKSKTLMTLPWGSSFFVNPKETIGGAIFDMGVYDMALTETVYRLVKASDFCLDVGANIGFVTNLMAVCCGKQGKVYAFEPHPTILAEFLRPNLSLLEEDGYQNVEIFPFALSNQTGVGRLFIPAFFDQNPGTASLEEQASGNKIEIILRKLDEFITDEKQIKLFKIDVEGHESAVFEGASEAFARKSIQHVIYEDHQIGASKATDFLIKNGYSIFRINKQFKGVILTDKNELKYEVPHEAPNYLATLHPEEVSKIFSKQGWSFLNLKMA
ncbi:MAG: FkbM family methyltransferase [Verrucomicrobia bacterium]|nr:FkbM family methyltransferase [Cytophagales bacterium]